MTDVSTAPTMALNEPQPEQAQGLPVRPARMPRRALHGVVLLDKPLGWSSNDALQKVKRLLRAEKAGHTGTLDPLATGLLPLFPSMTRLRSLPRRSRPPSRRPSR